MRTQRIGITVLTGGKYTTATACNYGIDNDQFEGREEGNSSEGSATFHPQTATSSVRILSRVVSGQSSKELRMEGSHHMPKGASEAEDRHELSIH
jgi:hypothetical protein